MQLCNAVFFPSTTDLHGVITTNLNKTLKVPDNLEAGQSQGLFILPPGSIDIKNGKSDKQNK